MLYIIILRIGTCSSGPSGASLPLKIFTFFKFVSSFRCLVEVKEKIESLRPSSETRERFRHHEDHKLFKEEHDEQLLLWTQRSEFNTASPEV